MIVEQLVATSVIPSIIVESGVQMRGVIFPDAVRIRLDPELRAGLLRLAEVERSTLSEVARRVLRQGLAERPAAPSARATRAAGRARCRLGVPDVPHRYPCVPASRSGRARGTSRRA